MANASFANGGTAPLTGNKRKHAGHVGIDGSEVSSEVLPLAPFYSSLSDDDDDGAEPLTARSAKRQTTTPSNGAPNIGSARANKKLKITKSERLAMEERLKENSKRLRLEADKLPFNEGEPTESGS